MIKIKNFKQTPDECHFPQYAHTCTRKHKHGYTNKKFIFLG